MLGGFEGRKIYILIVCNMSSLYLFLKKFIFGNYFIVYFDHGAV